MRFYIYGTVVVLESFLRFARIKMGSTVHDGIVILRDPEATAGNQKNTTE
jgi:hypothetical protein